MQLCGLSTIIREYTALRSISSLPFKDLIFTAAEKSCGYGDDAWKISGPLHDYFTENLNKSQKEAIDVSLSGGLVASFPLGLLQLNLSSLSQIFFRLVYQEDPLS